MTYDHILTENRLPKEIDPCQNLGQTTSRFPGTKDLRFITPDLGVGIKAVSHWDSTISTVYGNGYKL